MTLLGRPIGTPEALDAVGGFVEDPGFYPYLSGEANLKMFARLDGGTRLDAIGDALARVDLADRAGDRVSGYSTGMRQRLGIAAALIRAPRLLLLDEPTSGLDPAGTRAVAELVRELSAEGVAVLLSSHQIGELERVCDTYTVLRARPRRLGRDRGRARRPGPRLGLHAVDERRPARARDRRRDARGPHRTRAARRARVRGRARLS